MAVNWTITSPSFAQTKCGVPFGSEKNVPAGRRPQLAFIPLLAESKVVVA
jgi:hypothetical protein